MREGLAQGWGQAQDGMGGFGTRVCLTRSASPPRPLHISAHLSSGAGLTQFPSVTHPAKPRPHSGHRPLFAY